MAMSLLKPDGKGHLGIGDFYSPPTPCTSGLTGPLLALEQLCHRAWFRQDGIYFLQVCIGPCMTVSAAHRNRKGII